MVSLHSTKKVQAVQFLKYVLSTEGQKILMESGGYLPVKRQMYDDDASNQLNPHLAYFSELLEHGFYRPAHPKYTKISAIITPYLHKSLLGKLTVIDALKQAEREIKESKIIISNNMGEDYYHDDSE